MGKHLNLTVEILIAPGRESIGALREGIFDTVCTLGEYTSPDTDCATVGSLPTGVGLDLTHPLARNRTITLDEMAPYPVIWSESFDNFNRSIHIMYRERGLKSPTIYIPSDAENALDIMRKKRALGFGATLPFNQTGEA